jgi:hypothetical protein
MAKALDQFKEVQGLILVPTMLTNLTMLTIINYIHNFIIYTNIYFIYYL